MATFVLVPGMWLGAWVWRAVTGHLRAAGHEVHPLTLTGLADRAHLAGPAVDLDTHTEDVVRLVEAEDLRDVVLVGHSYGGAPVTAAAQRIPDRVSRVVYVDSGPFPDGVAQWDLFEPRERERLAPEGFLVPVRPWEEPARGHDSASTPPGGATHTVSADGAADGMTALLAGMTALLAGLDAAAIEALRTRATPHPLGSVRQPLRHTAPVKAPVTLIACVLAVEQLPALIEGGHPFFAGLAGAELRGLRTGHWPMLSEPRRLADLLAVSAERGQNPNAG